MRIEQPAAQCSQAVGVETKSNGGRGSDTKRPSVHPLDRSARRYLKSKTQMVGSRRFQLVARRHAHSKVINGSAAIWI